MELPGRCGDWLDTATVTVQGSRSGSTRRARGGDFYLATSGDLQMATCGDFLMATDSRRRPCVFVAGPVMSGCRSPVKGRGVGRWDSSAHRRRLPDADRTTGVAPWWHLELRRAVWPR